MNISTQIDKDEEKTKERMGGWATSTWKVYPGCLRTLPGAPSFSRTLRKGWVIAGNWGQTGHFPFFLTGNWGTFRLSPVFPHVCGLRPAGDAPIDSVLVKVETSSIVCVYTANVRC